MDQGPSRTALAAAMYRAAHQRLDGGAIFADPFAVPILPEEAQGRLEDWARADERQRMRAFIAYRSAVADRRLGEAIARGVRQVVVLGAGLDTLLLRNPCPQAQLYEVDHPATQAWKRRRLGEIGAVLAGNVHFAPCDFELQSLAEALAAAGFGRSRPAFFIWLGVVPYLTDEAVFGTLGFIAGVPGGAVVFDYGNPIASLEPRLQELARARHARVASIGEPFLSAFETDVLTEGLSAIGAIEIDDIGPRRIRGEEGSDAGGHVIYVRFGDERRG